MSTQDTSNDGLSSFIDPTTDNNFEISAAGPTKSHASSSDDDDEIEFVDGDEDADEEIETAPLENVFETWKLSKEVLKSLAEMKFTNPTAIQKQAIPILIAREKDFVGLAATGTGKTAAFGIPLIESIEASSKTVQALVMCPTRELAAQVEAQLQKIAKWKGLNTLTVFGGSSYDRQVSALKRGVHIVVGTPGRLCDLVDRKVLKLNDVQTLILDEADEMISMGFQDDLEKILGAIGDDKAKRKWLFSATMSPEIRRVVSKYLPDYDKVEIHKNDSEKPQIEQIYYTIYPDRKLQMLSSVLYMNPEFYGLVFCQTKREVQDITEWLKRKSFKVDCIHGDRPQRERDFILKDFRSGRVKILVATDVAARGLDINDLTHVINFSLPREVESYVHRIGRTGRAGKKGLALSIVAPHEVRTLKRIQQVTKANLVKGLAPSNDELNLYRVKDAISTLNTIDPKDEITGRASKFLDRKMAELKDLFNFEFTVEEFLKRYLIAEHSDIFENRDTSMDFVGDNIVPREMQDYGSKPRGRDGRDSSGPRDNYRDNGPRRDFGFRGNDRGGNDNFAPRGGGFSRERNDRFADRNDRGGNDNFAPRSGDGGFAPRSGPRVDFAPKSFEREQRSDRTDRFDRPPERSGGRFLGGNGFRPRTSEGAPGRSDDRGGGFAPRGERRDFAPRAEGRSDFAPRGEGRGGFAPRGDQDARPAGRTWNADDAGERPARTGTKRYVKDDTKPSRK